MQHEDNSYGPTTIIIANSHKAKSLAKRCKQILTDANVHHFTESEDLEQIINDIATQKINILTISPRCMKKLIEKLPAIFEMESLRHVWLEQFDELVKADGIEFVLQNLLSDENCLQVMLATY